MFRRKEEEIEYSWKQEGRGEGRFPPAGRGDKQDCYSGKHRLFDFYENK